MAEETSYFQNGIATCLFRHGKGMVSVEIKLQLCVHTASILNIFIAERTVQNNTLHILKMPLACLVQMSTRVEDNFPSIEQEVYHAQAFT